jgi:hypothetical protein
MPLMMARRNRVALQEIAAYKNSKLPVFHHERIRLKAALGLGARRCQ